MAVAGPPTTSTRPRAAFAGTLAAMPARPRPDTGGRAATRLDLAAARAALLAWYDAVGRTLPFRGIADAWAILVSEAMAQQTQAARAGEAWRSFMETYPTPAALAAASPAEVLRAWRGLGYNRRALALRTAAVRIVEEHGGRVPDDLEALRRLPGVGPYTAHAVAALAFGRPVGAVDTNVRRVLTRVAPDAAGSPSALQAFADRLVDPRRPGDWTHALMDLGATLCRGSMPDCPACPLTAACATGARRIVDADAAGEGASRRVVRERAVPFSSSRRWLRGRLVDRLRDAPDGQWVGVGDPIGDHDGRAVLAVLDGLERDGLLERHPDDPRLARLPTSVPGERSAR